MPIRKNSIIEEHVNINYCVCVIKFSLLDFSYFGTDVSPGYFVFVLSFLLIQFSNTNVKISSN